jgi:hypothetical protein
MEVRMSLAEAAALTNTAPNTMRSRFKSGKIRGERDNAGKIWVWIDPIIEGSKQRDSKGSKAVSKGSNDTAIEALKVQLQHATDELDVLRPKAALADVIAAEKALLEEQIIDLKADRDAWRKLSERRGLWGLLRR